MENARALRSTKTRATQERQREFFQCARKLCRGGDVFTTTKRKAHRTTAREPRTEGKTRQFDAPLANPLFHVCPADAYSPRYSSRPFAAFCCPPACSVSFPPYYAAATRALSAAMLINRLPTVLPPYARRFLPICRTPLPQNVCRRDDDATRLACAYEAAETPLQKRVADTEAAMNRLRPCKTDILPRDANRAAAMRAVQAMPHAQ